MSDIIYLATDHAGFELKEFIKEKLAGKGLTVEDYGAHNLDAEDDYPDFMRKAAEGVAQNPGTRGIIFGNSGQGEAMCANRIRGVRAAVYYGGPQKIITLSREHNDANILSLGAGFLSKDEAWSSVEVWLATPFSGKERHARRISKLDHA